MNDLKEFSIIETFRGLTPERQRLLLEKLVVEAKQTSVLMKFDNEKHAKLYEFARKQWPLMSTEFFNQLCARWEFLYNNSYGNNNISCCDVGDIYLQACSLGTDDYSEYPFETEQEKFEVFYHQIFDECKWKYMYITVLIPGQKLTTSYLIKDLMELSDEEFIAKMKEYKYIKL